VPYVPNTDADRREMLLEIGASSIDELFGQIPDGLRFDGELDVPGPLSEQELARHLGRLASMNQTADDVVSFLGGGIYDHTIPAAVRHVTGMPQFATAYTPYQAEVSQGTLQSVYEFQSLIARLTAMDVANASLYDGATAAAEAALMSAGATGRKRVVVAGTVAPAVRAALATYLSASGIELVETPRDGGVVDLVALGRLAPGSGAVIVQHPNFFGALEPTTAIAELAAGSDAFLVVVADPLSLALLRPPGEYGADVVVGEGQSLGAPMGFGGPLLGFLATRREHVRRMPGRIIGATTDASGRRAYVMTLQTREQHIRRAKATSNICTNEALVALGATVYLSLLGRTGFRNLATHVASKARYAMDAICRVRGVRPKFDRAFFREFVIELPFDAARAKSELAEVGIWPGLSCGCFYDDMENCLLVSVSERHTRHDIDMLASGLEGIVGLGGQR
jgi:glycine dehydrogenase subunit 1